MRETNNKPSDAQYSCSASGQVPTRMHKILLWKHKPCLFLHLFTGFSMLLMEKARLIQLYQTPAGPHSNTVPPAQLFKLIDSCKENTTVMAAQDVGRTELLGILPPVCQEQESRPVLNQFCKLQLPIALTAALPRLFLLCTTSDLSSEIFPSAQITSIHLSHAV